MNRARTGIFLLTTLALVLSGCSSTTVVDQWRDDDFTDAPLSNLLVIGMSKDPGRRRQYEDAMVRQLSAIDGVEALASYKLLPSEDALEKEQIVEAITGRGIDGVLITRLVGEDKRRRHVEPRTMGALGYDYYGYYYRSYNDVYGPGYLAQDTVVTLQTNLYDVATEELVWFGTTESFDPQSVTQIIDELATLVVEKLKKQELIP